MPVTSMDFLTKKRPAAIPSVLVVFGDEEFLRRQSVAAIRDWVVGAEADDFTLSVYRGDDTKLSAVLDDLFTPPFLGERRLVIVEDADDFISEYREPLLKYLQAPSSTGNLLLDTKSWAATTKLAKGVEASGLAVDAKAPKDWHVAAWCVQWAKLRYQKALAKPDAEWLVELVGTSLGQLDQEMSKLSTFVGDRPAIDLDAIQQLVAGTRTESAFRLLDLLLEGATAKALEYLDRQLVAGDSPIMIVAMLTAQLRKLTRAARAIVSGQSMDQALRDVGVPPFAIERNRGYLRHFGRGRMAGMYRRLLEADLELKGGSALDQRTVLERFLIELSRKTPVGATSQTER